MFKSFLSLPILLASAGLLQAQTQMPPKIEVAFVLDTTGSMADLIEGAKQKIWSITNTMVDLNPQAEISFALVGYRDIGDDYVTLTHQMTSDVQAIYGALRRFEADGGNDTPEAVNEALQEAVTKINWGEGQDAMRPQDRRILFLVGDAPPHMDYSNGPKYDKVIAKAREKSIIVNTIQAGDDPETAEYWRKIAQLGGGRYIAIAQDGGQLRAIPTPMDAPILQTQAKIDATILPYGTADQVSGLMDKLVDRKSASIEAQADNASYYAKKGGAKEAVTGGGDLVADIANSAITYKEIAVDLLPAPLKELSQDQRQARIETLITERKALEQEMASLVAQRDDYIAAELAKDDKGAEDSFDTSVKALLTEQLKGQEPKD